MKKISVSKTNIVSVVLTLLGSGVIATTLWLLYSYADIEVDQIIYQLKAPAKGISPSLGLLIFVFIFTCTLAISAAVFLLYCLLAGKFKFKITPEKFRMFLKKQCGVLAGVYFIASFGFFFFEMRLDNYLKLSFSPSEFFEENYADPNEINITFPETKRNLIFIFLESMETSYMDKENGGLWDKNCIPELTALAKENVNFSFGDTLGGAYCTMGSTWTAAAVVAQTAGVPVKVPLNAQNFGGQNGFMPGIHSLGEILQNAGYNQTLLMGSDSTFAAKDAYFSEHGNYETADYNKLKNDGIIPDNYYKNWGVEDETLLEIAKEKLANLYADGKPFNLTLLTSDTHFPDGYLCEDCENRYETQYKNVLACSSKRIAEFVNWCKEQPFYENTAIVIAGDHLTMDAGYMRSINENAERYVYNCFINSAVTPEKTNNRAFTTLDIFPSTLAALGLTFDGERLGLGTNLFSDEKTLCEKYGTEYFENELVKNSDFYNKEIIGIKQIF